MIPGDSPAHWLRAVIHWGLCTEGLRFLVFKETHGRHSPVEDANSPAMRSEPRLLTLIIGRSIPARREDIEHAALRSAADVPTLPLFYRCRADRLYLPIDAELTPHVTDKELRHLLAPPGSTATTSCAAESVLVWHPAAGLIRFASDEIPTVADLLRGPESSGTSWDGAQIGETLNDRLRKLSPEAEEDPLDVIQYGQDDIGRDADDIADAPRSPDEVKHPRLHDAVRSVQQMIAKGILGITGKLPERPNGSQILGRLHQWAESFFSGQKPFGSGADDGNDKTRSGPLRDLSSQRENEIKRLLNLLENDPDQGLRYAPPLYGDSSRGIAPPGGRLAERTPDFSHGQLGKSGRGDAWDLPWNYRIRLEQRYHDLAQRERRLDNYRRAAYIYATLLNDMNAAAVVLESGGFHRDAATLYEKHLKNPLNAAECLRNGGFWEEAVEIFRTHDRWIDAGELLQRMNQPEDARKMFANEIRSLSARNDFLKAGEVADQRLNDSEQASALLLLGWQQNRQAESCFRALLELHGRRGQHLQARIAIQNLSGGPNVMAHQRANAIRVCSEAAVKYPDGAVQEVARHQTWRLAGSVLSEQHGEHHSVALAAVRSLAMADELLQLQAQRFAAQSIAVAAKEGAITKKRQPPVRKNALKSSPAFVRTIRYLGASRLHPHRVPAGTVWRSVMVVKGQQFQMGQSMDGSVIVLFGRDDLPFVLHAGQDDRTDQCQLRPSGIADRVFLQRFPASSPWGEVASETYTGTRRYLDFFKTDCGLLLDFIQLTTGVIWALCIDIQGRVVLNVIGANGLIQQTIALNFEGTNVPDMGVELYALHHDGFRIVVQTGHFVWQIDQVSMSITIAGASGEVTVRPVLVTEFPEAPWKMTASPPHTTLRLAFSFQQGAQVVWPRTDESCVFAADFDRPLLACTGNGLFVAACRSSGRIECYRVNAGTAELIAALMKPNPQDPIVDLTAGVAGNEFLLLRKSGELESFQIPLR